MYFAGDIYPGWGLSSTRGETLPEYEEQRHYEMQDTKPTVEVTADAKKTLMVGALIIIGVLFILGT